MKNIITFLILLTFSFSFSQNDSINKLEEIVLKGNFSPSLNSGYSIAIISDSILNSEYQNLGSLLQNQVNLYFKQNGNGMVSSISLRGTSASQTGVYWNGIAVNSSLNGQTDFNTLTASSFDEVEIRKGGGSVLLGSGAIGGAINLRDKIIFQNKKEGNIQMGYGSYQSFSAQLKGLYSSDNLFAKVSIGGSKSNNDYPYLNTDLINENGEYKNYNISGVLAYKINNKNQINFYTSIIDNDRNISNTLTAESNSKLLNFDSRFLFDWKNLGDRYTSSLKLAYLQEKFTYFFDKDLPNNSKGESKNLITKYDFTYFLNNNIFFNSGIEYKNSKGNGSSIPNVDQNDFTSYFLFHHQPTSKLNYNLSFRKGISTDYSIPFIYAIDGRYNFSTKFLIRANYATNYRLPTFNDLYWEPGGNSELKSEKSNSTEIGFEYTHKLLRFNITTFYIKSKDLIQWQPVTNTLWQPQNIQEVTNYGIELSANAQKQINNHLLGLKIQYDYTISQDEELNKQLIYVPYHKANSILNYQYNKWIFTYNLQYTGEVFITTSNTQTLNAYWLSNITFNRNILKNKLKLSLIINNLFDENYQSVAFRPMPNRNFILNINLKI